MAIPGVSSVELIKGLLVFIRVLGIFSSAPVFSHAHVPAQVKICLALMVSMALLPIIPEPSPALANAVLLLGAAAVKEAVVGIFIGFIASLPFLAIQLAGEAVDLQIGFGLANIADPLFGTYNSMVGQFQTLLATLLFLVVNAHYFVLAALVKSFQLVPPGEFTLTTAYSDRVFGLVSQFFLIGMRIGGPVMLAVFLTELALSLVGRTVPQMNLMLLGFPVKILVGLAALLLTVPLFIANCQSLFDGIFRDALSILGAR